MANILLTGASGFIGSALADALRLKHHITAPVRKTVSTTDTRIKSPVIADLLSLGNSSELFVGCDIVVHTAAKAHVVGMSLDKLKQTNTDATLQLAETAARSGVKRFIFLSSIGVNGISNTKPFTIDDTPAPVDNYALSKLEAEVGLKQLAKDTDMEVVIIRPPLVYGANAPGNFGKLIKLAKKNLPLPLGAIHNKRSLVALDNLVDLVVTCIDHPKAANQTFLVSDDQDVSTTDLLKMMTGAAGIKPWLLPVPMSWLRLAGKITGRGAMIDRLCGNLQVDISHTKETLSWKPPITVEEGIRRCFSRENAC